LHDIGRERKAAAGHAFSAIRRWRRGFPKKENRRIASMGDTPQNESGQNAPSEGAASPGQGPQHGALDQAQVEAIITALQAEAADLKDKLLRAHAEMENLRKRAEREREETAKYAVARFARDIVNVGDNFQRAIDAVPPGAAEQDAALKSFLDGVTMTERELLNVLERHGIRRVHPLNEPFNPHLHQAVMEIQRTDVPSGTIVQIFQAGFMIEDRVLRPAMVAVSKGGPKQAPPSEGSPGPSGAGPANEN